MNGNSRVLATTIPGSSKAFIDSSVMNLALPAIQAGFRASVPALRWVASGDLLSLGALVLLGVVGDRCGRVRVFSWRGWRVCWP